MQQTLRTPLFEVWDYMHDSLRNRNYVCNTHSWNLTIIASKGFFLNLFIFTAAGIVWQP